jgi:diadenylate cyclase
MTEDLMDIVAHLIAQIEALDWSFNWVNLIEIVLICGFIALFYIRFIKNTNSEKFVKGLVILAFLWIFSEILIRLNLNILGVFLKALVTLVSLSLIVIFQPELRRFLGFLGQMEFFSKAFAVETSDEKIDIIKVIIESVKHLAKSRTGALIVFQDGLAHTYSEVGTRLNADLSTELILTIFHPNTPLHDGAVIINRTKIISAGALLPLTEDPKLSWRYGTRHRAAIGMSEVSNAACLVVSEETGDVSVAIDGVLKKYEDLVTLKADLENILHCKSCEEEEKKSVFNLNNFIKKGNNEDKNNTVFE